MLENILESAERVRWTYVVKLAASDLLAERPDSTSPKETHSLRDSLRIVDMLDTTMVVLIDDFDRGLYETDIMDDRS